MSGLATKLSKPHAEVHERAVVGVEAILRYEPTLLSHLSACKRLLKCLQATLGSYCEGARRRLFT